MTQTDCFAYEEDIFIIDDEYTSKKKYCKALTELLCKKKTCPFYKKKGTEREVIFHAQRAEDTDR